MKKHGNGTVTHICRVHGKCTKMRDRLLVLSYMQVSCRQWCGCGCCPQPVVAVVHCLRSRHGYGAGKGAGSFNFEAFSP